MRRRVLEIATFAALAWYAVAHWAHGLVAGASGARILACVAIAAATGGALSLSAASPRVARIFLRPTSILAGLGAGAVAIGLDRRLLAPARWGELAEGIERGFAGLGSAQWPYSGAEPWAALVLLLAVPLTLGVAAALAFWPPGRLRPVALVLLVALYAVGVTERQFSGELARGGGLLVLMAAWLWLPRIERQGWRTAAIATAAVFIAGVAALPAAARYGDREGWLDYEAWNPFEARAATRFDWSHSYGPIDWPRDGTTLMNVRSRDRHYWRLQTLDRFDGLRWVRAGLGRRRGPLLPPVVRGDWLTHFRVTIRDLDTDLFPVAGTALRITGADPLVGVSDDGTVEGIDESLDEGDSYGVYAYVPDPAPERMRAAPPAAPGEVSVPNTAVHLPPRGTDALEANGHTGDAVAEPLSGPVTKRALARSPYARVLRLARRLARGKRTNYDVVRAVQRHLRSNYEYSETPPSQEFPLAAFLFEDRIGYCQQFSGAMALMLRMLDIPARVAAGFTPGSYNRDTNEFRVRDLDAHSWVEVWFTGIGWVPFDPTPSIAPAESQSSVEAASASGGAGGVGEVPDPRGGEGGAGLSDHAGDGAGTAEASQPRPEGWLALGALLALGVAALAALAVRFARRAHDARGEDAELEELKRALARMGEPVPARLTLRQLEARLERAGGPAAARYARMLRARRYSPRGGRGPDAAARRELRRALARGRGPRARVAALFALPPAFRRG